MPASTDTSASAGARRVVEGLLRGGLVVAIGLMASGLVVKLASGNHDDTAVRLLHVMQTGSLGDTLMGLGILALGLTPAARVLVLAAVWAHQRDWRFVAVAVIVVMTLAVATLLGGA
jgi:uncharacterized membrane protein